MTTKLTEARITVLEAKIAKIRTQRAEIDAKMSKEIEHAKTRASHWTNKAAELETRYHTGGLRDSARVADQEASIAKLRGGTADNFA